MTRVLLVVALFVAFFFVAPAPAAHACSCAMSSTGQQVEDADLVVRGTIVGTEDPEGSLATISSARPATRIGHYRRLHDHVRSLAARDPGVCGLRLYVEG